MDEKTDILAELDELLLETLLKRLKSGEATVGEMELVRKLLVSKDYKGAAMKHLQEKEPAKFDLTQIPKETLKSVFPEA